MKHLSDNITKGHMDSLSEDITNASILVNVDILVHETDDLLDPGYAHYTVKGMLPDHILITIPSDDEFTLLFSVLAAKAQVKQVTEKLITLTQLYADLYPKAQWDARLITNNVGRFQLINVILTNIKQPQLFYLGAATLVNTTAYNNYLIMKHAENDYTDAEQAAIKRELDKLAPLKSLKYFYHINNIGQQYEKQLVASDQTITAKQLTQLYELALQKQTIPLKCPRFNSTSNVNPCEGIVLLSLTWLMDKLAGRQYAVHQKQLMNDSAIKAIFKALIHN